MFSYLQKLLPGIFLISAVLFTPVSAGAEYTTSAENITVLENRLPGTTDWRIPGLSGAENGKVETAPGRENLFIYQRDIEGYASQTSINKGQSINFHISTNQPSYSIDIYRMGWYAGTGGRWLFRVEGLAGANYGYPAPAPVTGMIEATWPVAYTLNVPTTWQSGAYLAKLTASNGTESYIPFVVRDDSRASDILYVLPITTYQAYNGWGGKSLYDNIPAGSSRSNKVSFDRPYLLWRGAGYFFEGDYQMTRWLEREGYDVTYATSVDLERDPTLLNNHRVMLANYHDEYWSAAMRQNITNARDNGVDLAFFTSNNIYWQIRYEPSTSGVPNRVIVCYKDAALDPMSTSATPQLTTVLWRDPPVNQPENELLGVMYEGDFGDTIHYDYVVANSNHWVYNGTGLSDGDIIPQVIGDEYDKVFNNGLTPPGLVILSNSPIPSFNSVSNASIYQAASGAYVFDASTNRWALKLEDTQYDPNLNADPRIAQMTRNLLNTMIGSAPSMPPLAPHYFYDDGLTWEWNDNPRAATPIDFSDPTQTYAGVNALSFTINEATGDRLSLHNSFGFATAPYTTLSLAVRATQPGQQFNVYFWNAANAVPGATVSLASYGGTPPTNGWQVYEIPLSVLNPSGSPVYYLWLRSANTTTPNATIYVDEIKLTTGGGSPGYGSNPIPGATILLNTTAGVPVTGNIVISETGTADLNISGYSMATGSAVTVSGPAAPFTIANGSGVTQTLTLTCNSATAGTFSDTLTVAHNAAGGPAAYTVICNVAAAPQPGYGSNPVLGATIPLSTTAGSPVTSSVVISETGTADLSITGYSMTTGAEITVSGAAAPFTIANGSGTTATLVLTCNSAIPGTFNDTLTVTHNATGSPATYNVQCTVTAAPEPGYGSSPAPGATIVLGTTAGTPVTSGVVISETGSADLTIAAYNMASGTVIMVSGAAAPFTITNGSGVTQALTVTCNSATPGTFTDTLTVTHNATGSPATYTVECTVTTAPGYGSNPTPGATISLSTTAGTPTTSDVMISETGTAALSITGYSMTTGAEITVSGPATPFTIADGGATQTLTLTCDSATPGTFNDTLTVTHNAAGSPATYMIECTVAAAPEPGYGSNPAPGTTIAFSAVTGTPATSSVVISETGTADLDITSYSMTGGTEIIVSGPAAPFTIADGGAAQTLNLTCNSTTPGTFSDTLTVTYNAAGSPATYPVQCTVTAAPEPGYGSNPVPGVLPALSTTAGTPITSSVVISETGTADLSITGYSMTTGAEITVSGPATPFTIADGGAAQTLILTCDSATPGTFSDTLTVTHNAAGSPAVYTVQCTVTAVPGYGSNPAPGTTITLNTQVGSPVASGVVISETGTADLDITSYSMTGGTEIIVSGPAAPFTIADGGAAQTLNLTCNSTTPGTFSDTLTVTHNAAGSPATYPVQCTVTAIPGPGYGSIPAPGATITLNTTVGIPVANNISISETGTADLNITGYSLASGVEITVTGAAAPFTIPDGSSTTQALALACSSAMPGVFSDTLTVTHNAPGSPATYPIQCIVTVAPKPPVDTQEVQPPSASGVPQFAVFDPALSKLGLLQPGQLGLPGEQLTWFVTVINMGDAPGTNVVITDVLHPELRVDRVEASPAMYTVVGSTVTFTIPVLNPGQSVEMRIYTTMMNSPADGILTNEASLVGTGVGGVDVMRSVKATLPVARRLPSTGYPPGPIKDEAATQEYWWVALLGVLVLVVGLFATGRRK